MAHHQARHHHHADLATDLGFDPRAVPPFAPHAVLSQHLVICRRLLLLPDWAQYQIGQELLAAHWLALRC